MQEVNELHMEIIRRKDLADAQTKKLKAHMRQVLIQCTKHMVLPSACPPVSVCVSASVCVPARVCVSVLVATSGPHVVAVFSPPPPSPLHVICCAQLQHENADLRFLNSQYASQIKSLEKENDVRQKRIDRLLEQNLQVHCTQPVSPQPFGFVNWRATRHSTKHMLTREQTKLHTCVLTPCAVLPRHLCCIAGCDHDTGRRGGIHSNSPTAHGGVSVCLSVCLSVCVSARICFCPTACLPVFMFMQASETCQPPPLLPTSSHARPQMTAHLPPPAKAAAAAAATESTAPHDPHQRVDLLRAAEKRVGGTCGACKRGGGQGCCFAHLSVCVCVCLSVCLSVCLCLPALCFWPLVGVAQARALQGRIEQLESEKRNVDAKIEAMQAQVARRDREIERLGDLLKVPLWWW